MWEASAPSNIALIKYMGKIGGQNAVNPSLSYSLEHLRSFVQIEENSGGEDAWSALETYGELKLSEKSVAKFLNHLKMLKKEFGLEDKFFTVRSGNNFPADCGIASSASSFAALTLCAVKALCEIKKQTPPPLEQMAQWSRLGSGSSCRSFFSGWVAWENGQIYPIRSSLRNLLHQVYIVSGEKKAVSSSEAHQKVQTSRLMQGRVERAQERFHFLKSELMIPSFLWSQISDLSWADFWDMHALFETAQPPFGYMEPKSLEIVNRARKLWQTSGDGPITTMDAGPNVHLLWRADQREQALAMEKSFTDITCLSNLETR